MDIYIVLDGSRVVGASARLQGAELMRAKEATRISDVNWPDDPDWYRRTYERIQIVNVELQDMDD